ncbi:MAG: pyruvate dehydrogenase complex E1 component subunit beta [Rhodobacteraceae bacterium]|nr:pyruvate dehydrogenase complex E1 component subunit beta [Paracoccaceae bacterium]
MNTEILMPALSPTMESGTLAKWLVQAGDSVSSGDIIAEIETDKAVMEFEIADDGEISELLVAEGSSDIAVNTPIAILKTEGSAILAAKPAPVTPAERPAESPPPAPTATVAAEEALEGFETKRMSVREALRDAMAEEMRLDGNVFLMGEEVGEYQGAYKVSQGLLEEFGARRVVDTPITEHGFAGIGVGAAFAGLRPIVEFMTFNFAMQAIDHLVNSAAKTLYMSGGQLGCPIVFRGPNGAASRVAAQHSQDYAAWYSQVPGLKVIQPFSASDAKGLLKSAIRDPNPVVFLESEILYGKEFEVPVSDRYSVPIGAARIYREGSDVTLVSFGIGMVHTLEAARLLAEAGIDAEVIDLRTLRPMDTEAIIASVKKTNRCVTVEEGWPICSIGNHISAVLMQNAFDWLDAPVINCTGKDVPMPYAANLERLALITPDEIVAAVRSVTYR